VALANQALESWPDSAKYRYTLGAVLYRAGQFQQALTHLEEAERLVQAGRAGAAALAASLPCFLAMTYHRQGDAGQAKRWLDRAFEVAGAAPAKVSWLAGDLPVWSYRLPAEPLRREAAELLGDSREAVDSEAETSQRTADSAVSAQPPPRIDEELQQAKPAGQSGPVTTDN
jgi:tetratricopeptide (TPR) repeat protein